MKRKFKSDIELTGESLGFTKAHMVETRKKYKEENKNEIADNLELMLKI